MTRLFYRGMVMLGILALVLAACGDDDDSSSDPAASSDAAAELNPDWRLALVTNVGGTISDGGFSESAHLGVQRAVEAFNLAYDYSQSKDDADYEIQLDRHIAAEANIIITVGFQMEAVTLAYARQHPDVYFIGVDQSYSGQDDLPSNLVGLLFAEDEAAFMVGALAGRMTASDVVGVIGGMEIPPVIRLAEGFRNGAQYVNPDVTVLLEYTGSFDDQDLGTATADSFIEQGADVIFGAAGTTGYAGIQHAARQGVWVIGVDQDEWRTNFMAGESEGSERVLTSAIKRVDSAVYQAVASIAGGAALSGTVVFDTADCGVGYAPFHQAADAIPEETAALVEMIWRALAAGTLETGVGESSAASPDPLAPGALPDVPEDAPLPGDCAG
jgi:basic membrane protein A and related proteins